MRSTVKVFLAVVLVFLLASPALAEDYITAAVNTLQNARVYVYPGTEGTDYYTSAKLESLLRDGDDLVLVMLPAEAEAGTDLLTLARSLSEGLEDTKIIGLAVGRKVIGYAPNLPVGVAADQMERAKSVSNDSVTALVTFSRNIHLWQKANVKQTPTPLPTITPIPKPTSTPRPPMLPEVKRKLSWLSVIFVISLVVVGLGTLVARSQPLFLMSKRKRTPKQTELQIKGIQEDVGLIRDYRVRTELSHACLVALGLVELLEIEGKSQSYTELQLPVLIGNMGIQVKSFLGHESKRHPISQTMNQKLREVLFNYDDLFTKLQEGNESATDLLASIIESNNAMIQALGYLPEDPNKNDQR